MDADDISYPNRLEEQLKFLMIKIKLVLPFDLMQIMLINGTYIYSSKKPLTWEEIKKCLPNTPFFHSSTMFKTDMIKKVGGYIEGSRNHFEDVIL